MANWGGLGELMTNAFQRSYFEGIRRKQDEMQFAERQRSASVLEAIQKARLMMDFGDKYAPYDPQSTQPPMRPPEGIIQSKSILGMLGDESMYVPRTEQVERKPTGFSDAGYWQPTASGRYEYVKNPNATVEPPELVRDTRDINDFTEEWEFEKGKSMLSGKMIGRSPKWKPEGSGRDDTTDDFAKLDEVIAQVKNLKSYPNYRYREPKKNSFVFDFLAKDDEGGIDPEGKAIYYDTGDKELVPSDLFRKTKVEPTKIKGQPFANKLMLKSGIANAVTGVKNYIKDGLDVESALQLIIEDNPEMTEEQQRALKKYFEWANL